VAGTGHKRLFHVKLSLQAQEVQFKTTKKGNCIALVGWVGKGTQNTTFKSQGDVVSGYKSLQQAEAAVSMISRNALIVLT